MQDGVDDMAWALPQLVPQAKDIWLLPSDMRKLEVDNHQSLIWLPQIDEFSSMNKQYLSHRCTWIPCPH